MDWTTFLLILQNTFLIGVLISAGFAARRFGWINETTERGLSRLLVDLFWPCLIFTNITAGLNRSDILSNISLPLLAVLTAMCGFAVALIWVRLAKDRGDKRALMLYQGLINNFVFMVLPFARQFLPQKGEGLLFMHNLGPIVLIWTLGVYVLRGESGRKEGLKALLTPGLLSTVIAVVVVLSGVRDILPSAAGPVFASVGEALSVFGRAALPVAMIVAGSRIAGMGRGALCFDGWNIRLILLRLVLVPGILFLIGVGLKYIGCFSRESLIIFMLVNAMPVSINSISLSQRFNRSSDLAAQGVVMTHLFALITVPLYILAVAVVFV
jgi:malate permease and related proteins